MRTLTRFSAFTVALLISCLCFLSVALADSVKADYQFQNTYNSSIAGAPALTDLINPLQVCPTYCNSFVTDTVDGNSRQVLQFPADNGLQLQPTTSVLTNNGIYTIAILLKFTNLGPLNGHWTRILDFKNGTSDNGLYVNKVSHQLQFFPYSAGSFVFTDNVYVQVVLTRDSSGTLIGYINGVQQFSVSDALNQVAVFDGSNIMRFFQDNTSSGVTGEASDGAVARIRIIDRALDAVLVAGLENNRVSGPTAADSVISGTVLGTDGLPLSGATVTLSGGQTRKTITGADGNYHFNNVETNGFYTVTPARVNYTFNPFDRSFSLVGNKTAALFTGTSTGDLANPLDTPEYFVRQQYVDVLGREPDEGGFNYWSDQLLACSGDADCTRSRRTGVAAAFFIETEYQVTGSFIYNLYKGSLNRRPLFAEYATDRRQVVGGANLEAKKQAFAESFVERAEFANLYQSNVTAESFVDALIVNLRQTSGVDLGSQRDSLVGRYNAGTSQTQSRSFVLRDMTESAAVRAVNYNAAFVLTEYFSYLRRNPDRGGYDFWLNVLNTGDPGNYRGMVCSFITSTEYQRRFSSAVTRSNAECSGLR